jgi:putative transposase
VKYRKSLLDEEVVQIIQETAMGIEERYEINIEALGMDKDHIHLFLRSASQTLTRSYRQVFRAHSA